MKPWFTWKGINSGEMGVVVESLPPISRPAMKVQTTEIDGRDGDEVIELGYESYDKEIVLGIKDTSEAYINTLMAWLSGEGYLITSVEPTKRYKCRIYAGIDLERLCRFRKGKVRLHTQPYKYAAEEADAIWNDDEKKLWVVNDGNIAAQPTLYVSGSGTINISVDGHHMLKLELGEADKIIINSQTQEAYDDLSLRNRAMVGNFVSLPPGGHEITWDGDITAFRVTPGSRWI